MDPHQVIRPENQLDIKTDRVCRFHREVEQTRSVVFCGAGKQCGLVRCMAVPFQCDDESVSHRSFPECYCFYDPSVSGVNVHLLFSLFWVFRGDNFIFFRGIHPPYLSFFKITPGGEAPWDSGSSQCPWKPCPSPWRSRPLSPAHSRRAQGCRRWLRLSDRRGCGGHRQ